ncbi:MAG: zf-HC2 domain-containing protein [Planctomycetota bacterium]
MNCRKAQKRLSALAAGELPENQTRPLREHLKECPNCRAELDAYERSLAALGRSKDRELPDGMWDGYWERIRDEAVAPQLERPVMVRIALRRAAAFAAAAAILVAGLVGWSLMRMGDQAPKEEARPPLLAEKPKPEDGEQPLRVVGRIDSPIGREDGVPRIYMLNDMARQVRAPDWVQPLPDFGRGGRSDRHYGLGRIKPADKDESKYEF